MEHPILIQDLGKRYLTTKSKQMVRYGLYKCSCGNEFKASFGNIKTKAVVSCGCSHIKHGLHKHRLYPTWNGMMARCLNVNDIAYYRYGGAGITICNRWLKVENFIEDMYPTFKEGLTLDRINPYGNYEPSNCRWSNKNTQQRNTKKIARNNTTGHRGVSFYKYLNKYGARIRINGKLIHLGYFINPEDGAKAYDMYVIENNLEHTINGI